jgi:hypothetical protein
MRKLASCSLIALLAPMPLAWADPEPSNRVEEGSIAVRDQAPLRLFRPQPLTKTMPVASRVDRACRWLTALRLGPSFKPAHCYVRDARRFGETLPIQAERRAGTDHFGSHKDANALLRYMVYLFS